MILAWWKRQWPQISTRIGLVLGALATATQYAGVDPRFGYIGAVAGIALVAWNQKGAAQ